MSGPDDELGERPVEPIEFIPADVNDVIRKLPPDQINQVDAMGLIRLQMESESQKRADQHVATQAVWGHATRMMVFMVLIGVIVLEFVIGVAVLVFADESWDEIKDLLAYGVAPVAAALGFASSYYFPGGPAAR